MEADWEADGLREAEADALGLIEAEGETEAD